MTVTLTGVKLKRNADYTVKYAENINIGTATVTIKGKVTIPAALYKHLPSQTLRMENTFQPPRFSKKRGGAVWLFGVMPKGSGMRKLGEKPFSLSDKIDKNG